ncbi:MAG: MmgE/PrpD family protein [Synergistaceae bacterium]|nr:MmgE/PrpD family protein [Synergistaceae bacterium]
MIFELNYKLEDYVLNTDWDCLTAKVKERSVVCAIDLTTALILGTKGAQHRVGLGLAKKIYKDGDIPIVGSEEKLSFMGATVAMSHAANSFDIDDGHNMIRGHPGASFVGGLLAASLEKNISYKDYLTSLVISYEATIRWALAMQDFYRFMHSTGAYGAFGTAVGVGKVFGLDRDILNNALSIADFHAPMTPVMRAVEYPSMNKDGVPFGTMIGAMAVLEAIQGYKGKTHFLEMPEYQHLIDTLGTEYEILNLYFKPFTCCRWAHQPISACIKLMKDHQFGPNDVEKVKVYTFVAASRLSKIVPHTTDEAQYNIAYPVASSLVHGDLGYMQIRDESLKDEKVISMMSKLEFVVDDELESLFPEKRLAHVEIKLKNGKMLKSEVFAAPGEASDNVDHKWITDKFIRITKPLLSEDRQKRILDLLSEPDEKPMREVVAVINHE